MISRRATPADFPRLQELADASAYPYPNLNDPMIEAIHVVQDEDGNIIAAVAAKRIVELYLYKPKCDHPATMLHAVRMLHSSLIACLHVMGYTEANAFIPPQLAQGFGRRLMKTFGWVENWRSWARRF